MPDRRRHQRPSSARPAPPRNAARIRCGAPGKAPAGGVGRLVSTNTRVRTPTACGPGALNASSVFNDFGCTATRDPSLVVMSFVALHGFQAPILLGTCKYESRTGVPPTAESFAVEMVDASSPELVPISGVTTSVTVRPIAP